MAMRTPTGITLDGDKVRLVPDQTWSHYTPGQGFSPGDIDAANTLVSEAYAKAAEAGCEPASFHVLATLCARIIEAIPADRREAFDQEVVGPVLVDAMMALVAAEAALRKVRDGI